MIRYANTTIMSYILSYQRLFSNVIRPIFYFLLLSLVTSCYKDEILNLQAQINQLKSNEIASLDTQINSITASISDLQTVDVYIDEYIKELKKDGGNYENQITVLQEMDKAIENRISQLQDYVRNELDGTKDWVNATFATLNQLDSLSTVVANIPGAINAVSSRLDQAMMDLTDGYRKAIDAALDALEKQMKNWVNVQFADYYTIAQIDAVLDSLSKAHDIADDYLYAELKNQKAALDAAKSELTDAYMKAVEDAILEYDGKINDKILNDITAAKAELQGRIDAIDIEIKSIKSQLVKIETDIEDLINRIQSIAVIPQDADGSIVVNDSGSSTICFDLKPLAVADSISKVWNTLTENDRTSMIRFKLNKLSSQDSTTPVARINSVSVVDGEFRVGVEFSNLTCQSIGSLQILYAQSDVASEYFTIWTSSMPKHHISPTSIALLNVNPLYLTTGTQASIEFRVNPSNATFDFSDDDCQIELDMVGNVQTRSSYVTKPSNYKLVRVEYVFKGETEELKVGQYRAHLQSSVD